MPVLSKVKSCYILWVDFHHTLRKLHRYSLGLKIDSIFVEIIEAISIATFLSREEKQPWIRLAIRKTDTLKVLLLVLWEVKSLKDEKYMILSQQLEDIGRMLGRWNGQLQKNNQKQNSPTVVREK